MEEAVQARVNQAAQVMAAQAQENQEKTSADERARIKAQIEYMRRVTGQDTGATVSRTLAGMGRAIPQPAELYGFGQPPQAPKKKTR